MDAIYRFALKRTGDAVEADDLAQEIVVEILRSLPSLQDPAAFVGRMWRVAHRSWWRWVQSRQRHRLTCNVSGFESMADLRPRSPDDGMAEEQVVRMRRAVALLGRSYRQVLVLHYLRGMSTPEIARRIRLPVGTVVWRLHEARPQARRGMKDMKSNGERSYAPGKLWTSINGSISGPPTSRPWELFRRRLPQNMPWRPIGNPWTWHVIEGLVETGEMIVPDDLSRSTVGIYVGFDR